MTLPTGSVGKMNVELIFILKAFIKILSFGLRNVELHFSLF